MSFAGVAQRVERRSCKPLTRVRVLALAPFFSLPGATANIPPFTCSDGRIPRRCAGRFESRRLHVSPNVEAAAV